MMTKSAATPMQKGTRIVCAPPAGGMGMSAGSLLSVTLDEDEDVLWHWTHHQDGRSVATGYTIVPKSLRSPSQRSPP
jgi:hypothetical protein